MKTIALIALISSFSLQAYAQLESTDIIVGQSFHILSEKLNEERKIQVFLPAGYSDSDKEYPVLYILDGHKYFLHGVSLEQTFVSFRQTPQFIVVGINKTGTERNRNFSSNSAAFLEFIEQEVISLVDKKYRTSKKRLLFGWAYGGSFVVETMVQKPDLFDAYIASSPFPLSTKIKAVDSLLSANPEFDKVLFFTSGSNEGVVKDGTDLMSQMLLEKAPNSMNWTFRELEDEEHRSTPFTTLYHGILKYFKFYQELQFNSLEEFKAAGGLPYVQAYYDQRANQFGFSSDITDWTMFTLVRNSIRANDFNQFEVFLKEFKGSAFIDRIRTNRACSIAEFYLDHKKYDESIALFTAIARNHPNSARPLHGLGDAYSALNQKRKANSYYQKAKELE